LLEPVQQTWERGFVKHPLLAVTAIAALGGCSPAQEQKTENVAGVLPKGAETRIASLTPADLPPALTALVQQTVPNMTVTEAERKEREGRIYYDVEGTRADGSEVELDIQQTGDRFEVV